MRNVQRLTAAVIGSMMILTACNETSHIQQESVTETLVAYTDLFPLYKFLYSYNIRCLNSCQ